MTSRMSCRSRASVELPIHHRSQLVTPIGSTTTRPRRSALRSLRNMGASFGPRMIAAPRRAPVALSFARGAARTKQGVAITVAKVSEITSTSSKSFADAIERGIKRANKTLKNLSNAWIADQEVEIENGKVKTYRVRMRVTFVLED